eukprot:TRINITY_DN435_c2_g11_i1.p1 TRINITY_DN435_c2_g11~~TRINITY_DN435_c2_g11_i1.p1  ORF type:complete len:948 (-),score=370.43 TRINITY_DN435_c2_g11_i1:3556-6399(-)
MATTGLPASATMRGKRNPDNTISELPTTSMASQARAACSARALRAAGTPSPKNTTSGCSTPPQTTQAGTWKAASASGSSWASPSGNASACRSARAGLQRCSSCWICPRGQTVAQDRQRTSWMLPCSSMTLELPACWCKPSTFWVRIAPRCPACCNCASARWAALGVACARRGQPSMLRAQQRLRAASDWRNSLPWIGRRPRRTPSSSRQSGMPEAVLMPAPVSTSTSRRSSSSCVSAASGSAMSGTTRLVLWWHGLVQFAQDIEQGRTAEQVALSFVAAFLLKNGALGLGLHTLGQHRYIEAMAQRQDGAHEGLGLLAGFELADEAAVQLDLVEGEGAQGFQRRIAAAEIVHGDGHAHGLELLQQVKRPFAVGNDGGLGDFQLQPRGGQAGSSQHRTHPLDQGSVGELHGRQVDGNARLQVPLHSLAAGAFQHPVADGADGAAFLGHRNEDGRRDQTLYRMLPAQQDFVAGDLVAADGALDLVIQEELAAFQRRPDVARHGTPRARGFVHGGFVEADLLVHAFLGAIHGQVGIVEQLGAFLGIVREHRHADAGARGDIGLGQMQHGGQGALQAADEVGQRTLLAEHLEGDEFVTAETRYRLAFAGEGFHAASQFGEQLVAHGVAEGIVDFLEAIQVDADDGDLLFAAMQVAHGFVETLQELQAVGQAGHGIVACQVDDLGVAFELFGAVAGDLGKAQQLAVFLVEGVDHHVRPEARTVLAQAPAFVFEAAFAQGDLQVGGGQSGQAVLLLVEHGEMLAHDLLLQVTLGALGAGVPVGHGAIGIEHVEGIVGDAFHQQPETVFGVAPRLFHAALLGTVAGDLGKADQLAVFLVDGVDHHVCPETAAVLADAPALAFEAAVAQSGVQTALGQAFGAFGGAVEGGEVTPDDFLGGITLEALGTGVPVGHHAISAQQVDGVIGDALDQQAIGILGTEFVQIILLVHDPGSR